MNNHYFQFVIGSLSSVGGQLYNHANGAKLITPERADELSDAVSKVCDIVRRVKYQHAADLTKIKELLTVALSDVDESRKVEAKAQIQTALSIIECRETECRNWFVEIANGSAK